MVCHGALRLILFGTEGGGNQGALFLKILAFGLRGLARSSAKVAEF
jgi:hypothetical protein